MITTFRTLQLAILIACLPSLQSFISQSGKVQLPASHQNDLRRIHRSYGSITGHEGKDMNHLEEIEFDLYSDSIDYKLIQSNFNRGSVSHRESVLESHQLDSKTLQQMIAKESENAVRSASIFGGLLSVLVTRDIWYAASSFLIVNIFATQSNKLGTVFRILGAKMDVACREVSKIGRLLNSFCFSRNADESLKEILGGDGYSRNPKNPVSSRRNIANKREASYSRSSIKDYVAERKEQKVTTSRSEYSDYPEYGDYPEDSSDSIDSNENGTVEINDISALDAAPPVSKIIFPPNYSYADEDPSSSSIPSSTVPNGNTNIYSRSSSERLSPNTNSSIENENNNTSTGKNNTSAVNTKRPLGTLININVNTNTNTNIKIKAPPLSPRSAYKQSETSTSISISSVSKTTSTATVGGVSEAVCTCLYCRCFY